MNEMNLVRRKCQLLVNPLLTVMTSQDFSVDQSARDRTPWHNDEDYVPKAPPFAVARLSLLLVKACAHGGKTAQRTMTLQLEFAVKLTDQSY
jgi:hypothetical protein